MAKILGLPFDDYVDKQVTIRQTKLAKSPKDPEDLVVFNSSTAWVRLSSGVKIEPDKATTLSLKLGISQGEVEGINLASKLVLFGGSAGYSNTSGSVTFDGARGGVGYGLNKAYGFLTTSDQGLKPPPGITSINSSYKNNGSLRQAQVSIKCYSRSQFEALEAVYLRLGYSLVLEWGNSVYFDNSGNIQQTQAHTIPNILYKDNNDVDPDTVREAIQKNKKTTACNYDAMMAKVSNYSWTLNEDLSFDIKLDLISVGDIIDSLKANLAGSAGKVTLQVETSGSIQNIVNIVINKEVSKVNKLFYEMYDEVFKELLSKFGSPETQKAVQQVNNVEKTAGVLGEIKDKYNTALFDKLYEPYNLYKQAAAIWEEYKKDYSKFIVDPRIVALAKRLGYKDGNDLFNNLIVRTFSSSDAAQSVEDYKSKVDTLKSSFDNLKPAIEDQGAKQLVYLKNSTDPLGDLIRALGLGSFDVDGKYKVEKVQFEDGAGDYEFTELLQDIFFKEYNFDG
jgi:hypothetical protein